MKTCCQVEEGYTRELVDSEERESSLRRRLATLEDQLRVVSVSSSEATQSATEASSHLKAALEAAAGQRDRVQEELGKTQAQLRERGVALRNLSLALEGFTRQRDNELAGLERQAEARVTREQERGQEHQEQARQLKVQLERAQQGLEAAARLSGQLDAKTAALVTLRQEVAARDEMLASLQERLVRSTGSQVRGWSGVLAVR